MPDKRRPGPAPGQIKPGSITDRLLTFARIQRVFGYAEAKAALMLARSKDLDEALHRLMASRRIRPVDRGRYAVTEEGATLRADGHLAILWDGREMVAPPHVVAAIREAIGGG